MIEEDERIYGDGVNINSLIEGLDEEGERTMKKISICSICLAFIILLTFSISAFASGKTLRIAMVLWRGETKAEQGFKDGLKELGYSVDYTIMNAAQDRKHYLLSPYHDLNSLLIIKCRRFLIL